MSFLEIALAVMSVLVLGIIIYYGSLPVRALLYFRSADFLGRKSKVGKLIAEYNETGEYIRSIRHRKNFSIGDFPDGRSSYRTPEIPSIFRARTSAGTGFGSAMKQTISCSRQIVDSASKDPMKYLTKYRYSGIRTDRVGLFQLARLRDDLGILEYAVGLLQRDEEKIVKSVDPPRYIMKHFRDRLAEKLEIEPQYCDLPYPKFIFEYRSPGGRSGRWASITLDTARLDALIDEISTMVRLGQNITQQRSRMTQKLRDQIKQRDDFTCQICGVSSYTSPGILLEVDHIIPVSRGGMSVPENLQTLCWRCNREKSNKIYPQAPGRLLN